MRSWVVVLFHTKRVSTNKAALMPKTRVNTDTIFIFIFILEELNIKSKTQVNEFAHLHRNAPARTKSNPKHYHIRRSRLTHHITELKSVT